MRSLVESSRPFVPRRNSEMCDWKGISRARIREEYSAVCRVVGMECHPEQAQPRMRCHPRCSANRPIASIVVGFVPWKRWIVPRCSAMYQRSWSVRQAPASQDRAGKRDIREYGLSRDRSVRRRLTRSDARSIARTRVESDCDCAGGVAVTGFESAETLPALSAARNVSVRRSRDYRCVAEGCGVGVPICVPLRKTR